MKLIIIGGGISGLMVAHQLSKLRKYEIHVYELLDELGGMARSRRDLNGCATEYSWRIYFWFYKNLFSILKEIPDGHGTVFDNLSVKGNSVFMYPDNNHKSSMDYLSFAWKLFDFAITCDRKSKKLDEIPWIDFVRHASHEDPWETTPQVLGLDKFRASTYSVLKIGMQALILHPLGSHNYAMSKPTSEAWFIPWQRWLESQGVTFHFRHQLLSLSGQDLGRIDSVYVKNLHTNRIRRLYADQFVLNVPVNELARLVIRNPVLQREPQLLQMPKLAQKSYILQLCFQLHFTRPVYLADPNSTNTGFILVDSPWSIIIETREALFTNTYLCCRLPQIHGSWSILAGQDRVPGVVFHKPLHLCSENEIHQELWTQILNNRQVLKAAKKWNPGLKTLRELESSMLWSPMWPTFYYKNGRLQTSEPKFSNNAGTLKLRPSCQLKSISNLHLAGAYTSEALDIFSMEGACISGMTVAKQISHDPTLGPIYSYDGPSILQPLKELDCKLSN